MQERVPIYETYECDIGARVDGLSTGPPGFGCHNFQEEYEKKKIRKEDVDTLGARIEFLK